MGSRRRHYEQRFERPPHVYQRHGHVTYVPAHRYGHDDHLDRDSGHQSTVEDHHGLAGTSLGDDRILLSTRRCLRRLRPPDGYDSVRHRYVDRIGLLHIFVARCPPVSAKIARADRDRSEPPSRRQVLTGGGGCHRARPSSATGFGSCWASIDVPAGAPPNTIVRAAGGTAGKTSCSMGRGSRKRRALPHRRAASTSRLNRAMQR